MFKNRFHKEVVAAANRHGIDVKILDAETTEAIRQEVCDRYADGNDIWLWEHFGEAVTYVDERHWKLVGECVGDDPVLLFFNRDEDDAMCAFNSGKSLATTLGDCNHFEYYVTDREARFLVAVNHHDVVFGLGAVEDSMIRILDRRDSSM